MPFFTKKLSDIEGLSTINARAESITKAPTWREPMKKRRDREQFAQETQWEASPTTDILLAAGVEVRVKGVRDLMHLKSYAIDGRLLRTGAANWSPTGLRRQDNDVLYQSSPEAVARFERNFEEMWAKASNTPATVPER